MIAWLRRLFARPPRCGDGTCVDEHGAPPTYPNDGRAEFRRGPSFDGYGEIGSMG